MRYKFLEGFIYDDKKKFLYVVDQQNYIFKTLFFNPDSNVSVLSKSSIRNITINDSIFDPFLKGSLTILNDGESLERLATPKNVKELQPDADLLKGYTYRGDGRDLFYLEIIPVENVDESYGKLGDKFNNTFSFKNIFSLIDDEQIFDGDNELKRFSFIDFDEKLLREKNIFFSTTKLLKTDIPMELLSNSEREVPTGECLKLILKDGLFQNDINEIIFTQDGLTPNFDTGSSKIFYSSPSSSTAYDDLMYIYDKHTTDKTSQDFSFLKKRYYDGQYELQSAKSKFDKAFNKKDDTAGKLNLEKLFITGGAGTGENIIQSSKKSPSTIPYFGEKGNVLDFQFFNINSNISSKKNNTKIVHSYSVGGKTFNFEQKDSNIVSAKNTFDANYVSNMKGKDDSPSPSVVLNSTKITNLSYENIFSLYSEDEFIKKSQGINKLLKNLLFTNIGVQLNVKGQMFRKAGNFFTLDRSENYVENNFDDKLLGIYFIVEVTHTFDSNNTYNNNIIAVKTYNFKDLKIKENIL
jgi:hypothetical protein